MKLSNESCIRLVHFTQEFSHKKRYTNTVAGNRRDIFADKVLDDVKLFIIAAPTANRE